MKKFNIQIEVTDLGDNKMETVQTIDGNALAWSVVDVLKSAANILTQKIETQILKDVEEKILESNTLTKKQQNSFIYRRAKTITINELI